MKRSQRLIIVEAVLLVSLFFVIYHFSYNAQHDQNKLELINFYNEKTPASNSALSTSNKSLK